MSYLYNQIMQTICPCLFNKAKNNNQSFGNFDAQQFEKQEFIGDNNQEYRHRVSNNNFDDNFYESKFNNQNRDSTGRNSPLGSSPMRQQCDFASQEQDDEKVFQRIHRETQQNGTLLGFQQSDKNYIDMLPEDHQYYQLLQQKMLSLSEIFKVQENNRLDTTSKEYPLKVYCRNSQTRKTNIFQYFFELPSSYEAYENLLNNFEIQKTFDSHIDQYEKRIESPDHSTKVIYLSYHKVLIISPRDFIYVRFTFKKGNQFWSICTSIPNQTLTEGKTRGQIILTATKVVQKADNLIEVSVYSEIDMKMAVKPQMAKNKAKAEIKKYIDKCYNYLKTSANESIL